jgi:Mrp family chromosome partitioning ATPase
MHLEVHRSADAFNFVSQQTDEVRARLNQTEEELKRAKEKAGVTSVQDSTANLNAELLKIRDALMVAATEHAEQQALLLELERPRPGQDKNLQNARTSAANSEIVQQYLSLIARLASLRQADLELFSKYHQNSSVSSPEFLAKAFTNMPGAAAGYLVRTLNDEAVARDQLERTRQIRPDERSARVNRPSALRFVGAEKDSALLLARKWYQQQNATGFSYKAGKKDFDTLVKEAEENIIQQKVKNAQVYKASEDELGRLSQLQTLNQMQIDSLEKQRSELDKKYPGLAAALPAASVEKAQADLSAERARQEEILKARTRLVGIEARTKALESQLRDIELQAQHVSEIGPQIVQLERKKEIEENSYKYFQSSLEKARVDEALDPSKMPNISPVQSPSIAFKTNRNLKKVVLQLAGGGIGLGLGLAFLIELLLDRSVRRPVEFEPLIGIPPMLSIPYLNGRNPLRLRWPTGSKSIVSFRGNGHSAGAPWESDHFIRPYSEAIRDRLILYFEINRMNHKPKLVAVAGCSEGAGASTLAGGVAAALSETGDGKVLLVDMNVGGPEIHPFFHGAPACSLTEALVGKPAQAGENLYLATATRPGSQEARLVPRKFYDLMPHLKASDFDYIIFDMPSFSQTSVTLPMCRFMDKIVLVAEAEKSSRDVVKRAKAELTSFGASISVILNKARSRVPKWAGAEG